MRLARRRGSVPICADALLGDSCALAVGLPSHRACLWRVTPVAGLPSALVLCCQCSGFGVSVWYACGCVVRGRDILCERRRGRARLWRTFYRRVHGRYLLYRAVAQIVRKKPT